MYKEHMVNVDYSNSEEIIKFIKNSEKITLTKVYIMFNKKIKEANIYKQKHNFKFFGDDKFAIIIGDYEEIIFFLKTNDKYIEEYYIDVNCRNSAVKLLDIKKINARIEPGSIIRDGVSIGDGVIIMMGAVINIGAKIGKYSMIDMNAVVGARATIGQNVHIGAGTVIAGVLEPPSAYPVIIEDNVMIGANAVILEGIKVGKNSVIGAGSVVTKDVKQNSVVFGTPAKYIKDVNNVDKDKIGIVKDLR